MAAYHPELSATERKRLTKQAKVVRLPDVPRFVCRKLRGQTTILQAFAGQAQKAQQDVAGYSQSTGDDKQMPDHSQSTGQWNQEPVKRDQSGTRTFPRFDVKRE